MFSQQESSELKELNSGGPQGSVLGPLLFLLFINDVSNFATDGCVLNMYADDVIIHTSAATSGDLQLQLERLHSENTPHRPMVTHTIDSYQIPSQKNMERI